MLNPRQSTVFVKGLSITFYMIQLPDVDKSFMGWYNEGLMTFYISKYTSYLTEYEHNKEETKRYHKATKLENFAKITSEFFKNSTESRLDCMLANCGANVSFSINTAWAFIIFSQKWQIRALRSLLKNMCMLLLIHSLGFANLFKVSLYVISVQVQW